MTTSKHSTFGSFSSSNCLGDPNGLSAPQGACASQVYPQPDQAALEESFQRFATRPGERRDPQREELRQAVSHFQQREQDACEECTGDEATTLCGECSAQLCEGCAVTLCFACVDSRAAESFARCGCGRRYNETTWMALHRVGVMHVPAWRNEPGYCLELRNCPCGSTISVKQ